ncbi:glycogen debranching N-terminal domain-containing protein [Plantactinospora sp. B6F1]|uniref:amylo-alpha-1,6-glucosidase n=1 Tax=Plantactinospora sp. B6F1 TaxID=3158971 RepID=UPI0032D9062F
MPGEAMIRILDGNTFVLSDTRGDIEASPTFPTGFFSFDTRFLSTWRLTLDGESPQPLSVDDVRYFDVRFFLVTGGAGEYVDAKTSIIRERILSGGFDESITVLNHSRSPIDLTLRVDAGADFADLFGVKGSQGGKGRVRVRVEEGALRFIYQRETFRRETIISSSERCDIDERGFTFTVHVDGHGRWSTRFRVRALGSDGREIRTSLQSTRPGVKTLTRDEVDAWLEETPRLISDNEVLTRTYKRSLIDLAALRFSPLISGGSTLPAAGLPWFMTVFGRDTIFTSLQVLPFVPALAAETLLELAAMQAHHWDDFRDEEPGKIAHEFRYGETAAFEEQPHTPYYGTADATPLYVVLLDEYERWSGDADLVRRLESVARAALGWIDNYGDLVGNGYIWYQRRNLETGLENQCWKDSPDSISYKDGRLAPLPRATCELQGYAYDAKIRGARLARQFWNDPEYADRLEREAEELKQRFNRDFWVEDGQFYALGLDPEGKSVDALTSNMGHLLWSGIVPPERAGRVADHLLGPRLFSGWGVRTLATTEGRYNPVGYHVGTVWPFDNSIIAWGLWRYGFRKEVARIASAIFDASQYFGGRLPEAIAGYDRDLTDYPVLYPTACSPQAWSTGTPLLLVRALLGMEPKGDTLACDPFLPAGFTQLGLLEVPGRWGRVDIVHGEREVRPATVRVTSPL